MVSNKMNRIVIATFGAVVMSAAVIAAQQKSAQPSGSSASGNGTTVTYRGCLETGAASGKYSLIDAKEKGKNGTKDTATLDIVAASPKVKLDADLTKEVEITGTLSTSGQPLTLTATKITWREDYCGVPLS